MERLDIINEFNELHTFISNLLQELDNEIFTLLSKRKFINNVVRNNTEFGVCYPTKREFRTLYYSTAYTFFEDIEDKYGGRDNDVIFLISIDFFKDKSFVVSREIGTLNDDIEYEKSEKSYHLNNILKEKIYDMRIDFTNYINQLIDLHQE